jgi:hypothetical protein
MSPLDGPQTVTGRLPSEFPSLTLYIIERPFENSMKLYDT